MIINLHQTYKCQAKLVGKPNYLALGYLSLQGYSKQNNGDAKIFLNTYLLANKKAQRDGIFSSSFKPNKNLIGIMIPKRKVAVSKKGLGTIRPRTVKYPLNNEE